MAEEKVRNNGKEQEFNFDWRCNVGSKNQP